MTPGSASRATRAQTVPRLMRTLIAALVLLTSALVTVTSDPGCTVTVLPSRKVIRAVAPGPVRMRSPTARLVPSLAGSGVAAPAGTRWTDAGAVRMESVAVAETRPGPLGWATARQGDEGEGDGQRQESGDPPPGASEERTAGGRARCRHGSLLGIPGDGGLTARRCRQYGIDPGRSTTGPGPGLAPRIRVDRPSDLGTVDPLIGPDSCRDAMERGTPVSARSDPRGSVRAGAPTPGPGQAAPLECRCGCGSLLGRLRPDGVELKCRRCKRAITLTFTKLFAGEVDSS